MKQKSTNKISEKLNELIAKGKQEGFVTIKQVGLIIPKKLPCDTS